MKCKGCGKTKTRHNTSMRSRGKLQYWCKKCAAKEGRKKRGEKKESAPAKTYNDPEKFLGSAYIKRLTNGHG